MENYYVEYYRLCDDSILLIELSIPYSKLINTSYAINKLKF